jgi:hypothetical protein
VAIENTYNTTEENLLASIFQGLGGNPANIGNDQLNTKNDLLLAILNQIINGGVGGGSFSLKSQFGTNFKLAVDEEIDGNGSPTGTGSLTVTKI